MTTSSMNQIEHDFYEDGSDNMPVLQVAHQRFSTVSEAAVSASTSAQRSTPDEEPLTLDDDASEDQDLPADAREDSPVQHK